MTAPTLQDAGVAGLLLDITVRTAVGHGRTPLSAFDRALLEAGVADYNLIPLSSVIPPRSTVTRGGDPVVGGHGDRLYCVESVAHAVEPGVEVAAGLGWVIHPEIGGLFVEHTGPSVGAVEDQIRISLADMADARGLDFGDVHTAVATTRCEDRPVCALAIAAYAVADWSTP